MVDPNVLENCGIDSKVYSGYAFGMGVERITNLKYQVKDLRMFSENDGGAAHVSVFTQHGACRITSYNVCYTKLLRSKWCD